MCSKLAWPGSVWPPHLPWVLLSLRAVPKEERRTSSAQLVFGTRLTLLGGLLEVRKLTPATFVNNLWTSACSSYEAVDVSARDSLCPEVHPSGGFCLCLQRNPPPFSPQYVCTPPCLQSGGCGGGGGTMCRI
jgi:hypothetical protein